MFSAVLAQRLIHSLIVLLNVNTLDGIFFVETMREVYSFACIPRIGDRVSTEKGRNGYLTWIRSVKRWTTNFASLRLDSHAS